MDESLRPRDWLLLLFDGAERPIDRVRIQKAMFLFSERSKAPAGEKYYFQAYDYGPFSFEIYPDLAHLQSQELIKSEPGVRSPIYSITTLGRNAAEVLKRRAVPERVRLLQELREYVTERSFNRLLEDIYKLYPAYAVKSVFRRT